MLPRSGPDLRRRERYRTRELHVFHLGALNDWHDVEQTTLSSVCLVPAE
jgi:hypothetical protein